DLVADTRHVRHHTQVIDRVLAQTNHVEGPGISRGKPKRQSHRGSLHRATVAVNRLTQRVSSIIYETFMPYTIIDSCTGCSACESRCPTAAIHGVKKELYYIDPALCIDCGACGAVCPDDAILDTYGRLCEQLKAQQRPKAFVELEKCTGCVYCVNACPFDCIT